MNRIFLKKNKLISVVMMVAMLLVSSLSMSACRGIELKNKTEEVEGYTESQAMIVLTNEMNRYRKAYTDDILKVEAGDSGESFEELLIDNVKAFLEQVKLLCMLAEERGISVTSQERDSIRALSELYYSSLTPEDKDYIGCSLEDVQRVYEDYFLADKLINELTKNAGSEISDSEAKVIEIQQIALSDEKKALAVLKLLKIDGLDFATLASRYNEAEETALSLRRDTIGGLYEDTAFSLDEGEISNIIKTGDLYYILKCTNGYDEKATQERKRLIENAIDTSAFSEVYEGYKEEHNIRFGERFWNDISLGEGSASTADNFFRLYDEAFPG
ncbi:MAG TPA: peptidyl-prolyl cis-trans isomerase [Candidatus Avilachnospira avistercoris]|nr:peptidyl-prolyl cis-trans isomerase [Candidatus Avilachnospira avistercoris]